jgi:hypothetical protein
VKGYPFEDGPTAGLEWECFFKRNYVSLWCFFDISLTIWMFLWWLWMFWIINGLVLFWKRIETGPTVKATFKTVWKNSRGLITWVIPFLFLELNLWDRLTIAEGRLKVIWFGSFHKLEQCWMFLDVGCFFMIFVMI